MPKTKLSNVFVSLSIANFVFCWEHCWGLSSCWMFQNASGEENIPNRENLLRIFCSRCLEMFSNQFSMLRSSSENRLFIHFDWIFMRNVYVGIPSCTRWPIGCSTLADVHNEPIRATCLSIDQLIGSSKSKKSLQLPRVSLMTVNRLFNVIQRNWFWWGNFEWDPYWDSFKLE